VGIETADRRTGEGGSNGEIAVSLLFEKAALRRDHRRKSSAGPMLPGTRPHSHCLSPLGPPIATAPRGPIIDKGGERTPLPVAETPPPSLIIGKNLSFLFLEMTSGTTATRPLSRPTSLAAVEILKPCPFARRKKSPGIAV